MLEIRGLCGSCQVLIIGVSDSRTLQAPRFSSVLLAASSGRAQSTQSTAAPAGRAGTARGFVANLKKDFDQRLAAARGTARRRRESGGQAAAAPAAAAPPSTAATGASVSNANFNPDMAVIGDFLGALGRTTPANVGITPLSVWLFA